MKVSVVRLLALSGLMLAAPLQAAPIGRLPADVSPVVQVQRVVPSSPKPIYRFEQQLRPPRDFVPSRPGGNVFLDDGSVTTTKELLQQQQFEMARRSREKKSDPCQEKHPLFSTLGPTIPGLRTTMCDSLTRHNPQ
jgi:hypothetical protein